jgi:hypothetical protein
LGNLVIIGSASAGSAIERKEEEDRSMRALFRLIMTLVVLGLVLVVGLYLWTGNLGFLSNLGVLGNGEALRNIEVPEIALRDAGGSAAPGDTVRLTWQGDEMLYNGNAIDEETFAALLQETKADGGKVEITKHTDVTVETADRWRQLLDAAEVRYEIIPQE